MAYRSVVLLVIASLALSILPLAGAMPDPGEPGKVPGPPWWLNWPGDGDGDGVHDHLRAVADQALASDPEARVEVAVDLAGPPRSVDLERLELLGMEIEYVSRYVDAVLGSVPANALDPISTLPGVVMLEWQGIGRFTMASAGPSVAIDRVREDMGYDGTGVTVAVLDTGVRASHASLDDLDDSPTSDDPKLKVFYDAYANRTTEAYDSGEHGTWVSGIAVGTGQPGGQNIGGAPGAWLVGVRIGSSGGFPESTALRGIEWVIENKETYNISVMVCSWGILLGGPNDHNGNSAISRAADRAVEAGINVVVAAGNSALSATVTAPGDANDVVTVGSVNDDHRLSSFSSEGPTTDGRTKPDVTAPGESITGPWSTGDAGWYTGDGTSASAPLVGGIIATMLEANPDLTPAEVKQILHESSEHNTALAPKYLFTPNNGYGWGVVHAPGAVSRAKDLRSPRLDLDFRLDAGQDLDLEVVGSYTRTPFTELGEDGQSRLGEDEVILVATVPDSWSRPSRVTYDMEGDIFATIVPEPITQENGDWRLRVTFRIREDVDGRTTAHPTIRFSTTTPVGTSDETFTLTTRETLNSMVGPLGRIRTSVGGNVPPEIEIVNPDGGSDTADTFYIIRWADDDPSDNARIALYNDVDTDPSNGKVLIADNIPEDPDGEGDTYLWDTSTLVEGREYYVLAVIDDGANDEVSAYSTGTVTIRHTGANAPPSADVLEPDGTDDVADLTYTIQYVARDPDNVASVSLYWDENDGGFDGVSIVRDLEEADGPALYVWDTSSMPDGAVVYVYVVVSDGQNPQARAYGDGPVSIDHQKGPTVEDASPVGQDVPVDTVLRMTFDREMDRDATEAALGIVPQTPGSFDWVGFTMRFTPLGGWSPETTHTVTLSREAKDASGRALEEPYQWTFTTGESPTPVDPPVVSVDYPIEGQTVSGLVWIEGTSTDLGPGGVVEVRIDGGVWEEASGNEGWSWPWETEETFDGDHTISARGVASGGISSSIFTVNVTVRNSPNSPPIIKDLPDVTVEAGKAVSIQVVADDDDGDTLIFSDESELFDINPSTGLIAFTPTEDQVGIWSITVYVYDGTAQTEATFLITVKEKGTNAGGLLGWLELTPLQTVLVLALIAIVLGAMVIRRGANRREEGTP